MHPSKLAERIESKQARLTVIGLGYVGLPVACLFADAGFAVVGLDVDQDKVDAVNQGRCAIQGREPGLAELVARVVGEGKLRASTHYEVCEGADIILVAVETPVDPQTHKPRYAALRAVLTDLGPHVSPGTLVIIESTLAPGTMQGLVELLLEDAAGVDVNQDLYLVHCPERVMPGKLLHNLRHMHRVVGGSSPEAADLAVRLYRHVVEADLDPVDALTAELVKTMENAYRDVQIAFANEMALLCRDLGADVWEVRELVNKSPGRHMLYPGAGVGGHCIPKDPWLLIANARDGFQPRVIPAARAVNDGMPHHMVDLTVEALQEVGVEISEARVALLGYAYLENADDTRNSPSEVVARRLRELGAEVVIHDPLVPRYDGDLPDLVAGSDALVIMVAHDTYRHVDWAALRGLMRHAIAVDGRRVVNELRRELPGFTFRGVGRGRRA